MMFQIKKCNFWSFFFYYLSATVKYWPFPFFPLYIFWYCFSWIKASLFSRQIILLENNSQQCGLRLQSEVIMSLAGSLWLRVVGNLQKLLGLHALEESHLNQRVCAWHRWLKRWNHFCVHSDLCRPACKRLSKAQWENYDCLQYKRTVNMPLSPTEIYGITALVIYWTSVFYLSRNWFSQGCQVPPGNQ